MNSTALRKRTLEVLTYFAIAIALVMAFIAYAHFALTRNARAQFPLQWIWVAASGAVVYAYNVHPYRLKWKRRVPFWMATSVWLALRTALFAAAFAQFGRIPLLILMLLLVPEAFVVSISFEGLRKSRA